MALATSIPVTRQGAELSERDGDYRLAFWATVIAIVIIVAYFEVDSRFQLNHIRDLQRRVGQLEEQMRR